MPWSIRKSATVLIAIAAISNLRAEQPTGSAECQSQVLMEIIRLRAELAEFSLEQQDIRIAALTRELEKVRAQSRELADQDRQQAQSLADIERQLTTPELEPEARPQIEASRIQLITHDAQKSREERAVIAERDADLTQRLQREIRRRSELQERARQLQLALSRK
jgi:hypothetical protein